jgi:hypothetical protein
VPINNLYGMNYQGGQIFYLDEVNSNGLVITSFDLPNSSCYGCNNINFNTNTSFGSGLQNTENIVSNCLDSSPANICYNLIYNGYNDWYLPSIDELIAAKNQLPNWVNYYYFSSSQNSTSANDMLILSISNTVSSINRIGINCNLPRTKAIRQF